MTPKQHEENAMSATPATPEQVRAHYEAQGHDVRIDSKGHVEFSCDGYIWLEGRWVSEYRVVNGNVHLI